VGHARFPGLVASGVVEIRTDLDGLDRGGFWAVVVTFEGTVTCVRLASVTRHDLSAPVPPAPGPSPDAGAWAGLDSAWHSSLDEQAYRAGVADIRRRIAAGQVYQVNLCRVLRHRLSETADLQGLYDVLAEGNPAPYACLVDVPEAGLEVVSASPELFLRRSGDQVESRPIKGTAVDLAAMLPKDYAENVMIADLVRNDLAHVCRPGSVGVDALCAPEEHPGLVHLVTTVSGRLRPGVRWREIADATLPPGSVSGAPKSSALRAITELETAARGPYCGAVGWVDADAGEACLAVGIRTFWARRDLEGQRWLEFGTGAGITWGSDPGQEWRETELKAARLVGLASGRVRV
jgi:para-aminobenzoate synthetase component 1